MSDRKSCGGIFDNDLILWFIILFLLLFTCKPKWGFGPVSPIENC
jgi:hypothetical protein